MRLKLKCGLSPINVIAWSVDITSKCINNNLELLRKKKHKHRAMWFGWVLSLLISRSHYNDCKWRHWRWTVWCLVRRVTKLKMNYMPKTLNNNVKNRQQRQQQKYNRCSALHVEIGIKWVKMHSWHKQEAEFLRLIKRIAHRCAHAQIYRNIGGGVAKNKNIVLLLTMRTFIMRY